MVVGLCITFSIAGMGQGKGRRERFLYLTYPKELRAGTVHSKGFSLGSDNKRLEGGTSPLAQVWVGLDPLSAPNGLNILLPSHLTLSLPGRGSVFGFKYKAHSEGFWLCHWFAACLGKAPHLLMPPVQQNANNYSTFTLPCVFLGCSVKPPWRGRIYGGSHLASDGPIQNGLCKCC